MWVLICRKIRSCGSLVRGTVVLTETFRVELEFELEALLTSCSEKTIAPLYIGRKMSYVFFKLVWCCFVCACLGCSVSFI